MSSILFSLVFFNALLLFSSAVGGVIPLIFHCGDRVLHWILAFAAGVFLGAVFLHLIPEIAAVQSSRSVWLMPLLGLLLVFCIEMAVLSRGGAHVHGHPGEHHDERHAGHHGEPHSGDDHPAAVSCGAGPAEAGRPSGGDPGDAASGGRRALSTLGYAAFAGLSIHSLNDGLSLGVGILDPHIRGPIVVTLLAHKAVDAFSLMSIFRLSAISRRRSLMFLLLFLLTAPIGSIAGVVLLRGLTEQALAYPVALATGSFAYVGLCDLLPEVLHHPEDRYVKIFFLILGLALMWGMAGVV